MKWGQHFLKLLITGTTSIKEGNSALSQDNAFKFEATVEPMEEPVYHRYETVTLDAEDYLLMALHNDFTTTLDVTHMPFHFMNMTWKIPFLIQPGLQLTN